MDDAADDPPIINTGHTPGVGRKQWRKPVPMPVIDQIGFRHPPSPAVWEFESDVSRFGNPFYGSQPELTALVWQILRINLNSLSLNNLQANIAAGVTLYQIAVAYAESNQSYSNDYNTYTSVWGVGPTTNQAYAIANLEVNNGYTLQNIRSLLVYSPTTVSNVSTIYTNALGRADTPQDLAAQQSFLLNGGNIYGSTGVVGSVVFSQECAGDISSFYALILGRTANPGDIAYNQDFLMNGPA